MAPEQGLQDKTAEENQTGNGTNAVTATNNENKSKNSSTSNPDGKASGRNTTPRQKKIKTTWISYLHKGELEAYLRECGMDDIGVVDDLRRRLSTYVSGGNYSADVARRFAELETRHTPGASTLTVPVVDTVSERQASEYMSLPDLTVPPYTFTNNTKETKTTHQYIEQIEVPQYHGENPRINPPSITMVTYPDIDDRTFDRVRTWGLHFDDRANPIDFIDRIEQLAAGTPGSSAIYAFGIVPKQGVGLVAKSSP